MDFINFQFYDFIIKLINKQIISTAKIACNICRNSFYKGIGSKLSVTANERTSRSTPEHFSQLRSADTLLGRSSSPTEPKQDRFRSIHTNC